MQKTQSPQHRFYRLSLGILLSVTWLAACSLGATPTQALTPITVQLSWLHQAEFAGLYAADQLGYFKDEGLEVSFLEGGAEVDFIAPVVNGSAQFGVAQPADAILARADGSAIRSIAVIYRHSPIVFFALKASGIRTPQDFVGKNIRSTVTVDQTLLAMLAKVGVDKDQYQVEYLPSDIVLFAAGQPQVWGGFVTGLALEVQQAGYEIDLIYPDDYGIHFYGDVLITTDALIAQNSDLVLRFTRAALKGWTYVVEKPAATGAFVQKYRPKADEGLEIAKMVAAMPLINTGEDFIGWMKPNIWTDMEQTLLEQSVLMKPFDIAQVFTQQFLEQIYK